MSAANHFPPEGVLSPDEQEIESVKYLYHPLLFIKLRSGRIGVCSGLGARTRREIVDASSEEGARRLVALVMEAATTRSRSAAEERLSVASLDLADFPLDSLLKDLNLDDL